jgi:hypothetical protein
MEYRDIIKAAFAPGDKFYSNKEIADLLRRNYNCNDTVHVNSKIMKAMGLRAAFRTIKGKTYRGFLCRFENYTLEQVQNIIYKGSKCDKSPEEVHKKIRFLIRDWDELPLPVQLAYKKNKATYLKEVLSGADHSTDWFYKIIADLPGLVWEGKDIDFIILPAGAIIKHLRPQNVRRPDLDKVHFILTEHNYVRIQDLVYGRQIIHGGKHALPEW